MPTANPESVLDRGTGVTSDAAQVQSANVASHFNLRAFTSLIVLFSFLVVTVTGLILYYHPSQIMSLSHAWGGIHTVLSFVLIIGGAFHLKYNWRPMIRYIKGSIVNGMQSKRECMAAFLIVIFMVMGTAYNLPVFKNLAHFGPERHHRQNRSAENTTPQTKIKHEEND